ncbi:MAG TPA: M20/M25/M40 family metallo-hydrolase [Bryobacteraceae bacterium]|jgi:acetylornithine deacetylase/succinyl-diaminopimelate desuccinylase-like protein|nr:M20/M25/M40 family metallo-hydrolase [Bryobacteraceae bacterium]
MVRSALCLIAPLACFAASTMPPEADQRLAHDIYKEIVEIKSGFTTGATTPVVDAVAKRLRTAGFPESDIFIGGVIPTKANLVVRYHGTGKLKPILLLAHIDVVEAKREDWSMDPFVFTEKDGYYYGRGTSDDKAQAAIWIANLIRYKREGYKPDRDIIVALTADEEGGGPYNGVDWLVKKHRNLIDADLCLNEGGRGEMVKGKRISNSVQAAEKWYLDLRLEVRNKGGHSSQPVADNAIYHLAGALVRISQFGFPLKTNETTRAYFAGMAKIDTTGAKADLAKTAEGDAEAMKRIAQASPAWNSMLRTTCVATLLEGGHAHNALPQLAAANINCRVQPDDSLDYVMSTLKKAIADDQVNMSITEQEENSPASPLRPELVRAMARLTDTMWPGVVVLPTMSTGATDGRMLRAAGIPTYGVQGLFGERDDNRAHGRDERMMVTSFYEGQTFLYDLVKALATAP